MHRGEKRVGAGGRRAFPVQRVAGFQGGLRPVPVRADVGADDGFRGQAKAHHRDTERIAREFGVDGWWTLWLCGEGVLGENRRDAKGAEVSCRPAFLCVLCVFAVFLQRVRKDGHLNVDRKVVAGVALFLACFGVLYHKVIHDLVSD